MSMLPTDDPEYLKNMMENIEEMRITAVWDTSDGDKETIIRTGGIEKDEMYDQASTSFHYFINADSPSNMTKFQLETEKADLFVDLAETIYGYKCELIKQVRNLPERSTRASISSQDYMYYYTDFILRKPWGTNVHYKSMSDGEKKIATLIRNLCDPTYMQEFYLIIVDNIEMHVYWKRHQILIDKLLNTFPDKQFILTTHSGVLPSSLPKENLYDIEEYKIEEAKRLGMKILYKDMQAKTCEA